MLRPLHQELDRAIERLREIGAGELLPTHLLLLRRIGRHGSRIDQLATEARVPVATLRRLLKRLEEGGLVERARDDGDRRVILVRLTPEGRSIRSAAVRKLRGMAASWSRALGPERTAALYQLVLTARDLAAAAPAARRRRFPATEDADARDRLPAAEPSRPVEDAPAPAGPAELIPVEAVPSTAEEAPLPSSAAPPSAEREAEQPVATVPIPAPSVGSTAPVVAPAAERAVPRRPGQALQHRIPLYGVLVVILALLAGLGAVNHPVEVPAAEHLTVAGPGGGSTGPTLLPLPLGAVPVANGPIAADPRNLLPGGPLVALTFDDGPDPRSTPAVLDILSRYGVSGTFFMVGREAALHPELVAAVARRGNTIGNHTWNHATLTGLSDARFSDEVDRTDDLLAAGTGYAMRCVRPPYGRVDAVAAQRLLARGLQLALWNVDPFDWSRPGVRAIVQRVVTQLRPGAVITLHDGGGDRSQTLAALPLILDQIRARGLRAVPVCGPQTGP